MAESTHRCEVYEIKLEKHPDPEVHSLSVVHLDGYTCVVNTEQWSGVKLAAHVLPDTIVNTFRSEFAFLAKDAKVDGRYRVRGKKIRKVLSFGLLVPAPEGSQVGDDVFAQLELEHYEPELNPRCKGMNLVAETERGPGLPHTKYNVEAGRKYSSKLFEQDVDEVVITEKIHGANAHYVFHHDRMYCSSRNDYKREFPDTSKLTLENLTNNIATNNRQSLTEEEIAKQAQELFDKIQKKTSHKNTWWQVLENVPEVEKFCRAYPDHLLYGEVVGVQGGFLYHTEGKPLFVAFDIMYNGRWLDYDDMISLLKPFNVPTCPVLYRGKFNFEKACQLAEGKTVLGNGKHVREGVVVRTVKEREDTKYGRSCLKWVGVGYLEKDQPEPLENQDE